MGAEEEAPRGGGAEWGVKEVYVESVCAWGGKVSGLHALGYVGAWIGWRPLEPPLPLWKREHCEKH